VSAQSALEASPRKHLTVFPERRNQAWAKEGAMKEDASVYLPVMME